MAVASGAGHGQVGVGRHGLAGLIVRLMPLLGGVAPSSVGLVVGLSLGVELGVVVLLLVLVRGVHVGVGLRVLLAWAMVGVGGGSLLLVARVGGRIVEGVDGLVVVRMVGGWRRGASHAGLTVVWVRVGPHAVRPHGAVGLALGLGRHGWISHGGWPSLGLHAWIGTNQQGLLRTGTKALVFINAVWRP